MASTAATVPDASSSSSVGQLVTSILSEHEALRTENADLRAQLAVARQHIDPVAAATIHDLQQRFDREREHHAATRNAMNAMRAAWEEFERHAAALDARQHDARIEVSRVMGGLTMSAHFQYPSSPMGVAGGPLRLTGPARTLPVFPGMPATLPPAPTAIPAHRHRPDGNDERPTKRHRADGPRHAGDSPIPRPSQYLTGPGADPGYLGAQVPSFAFAPGRPVGSSVSPKQNGGAELRGRPRSRASMSARSRSRSLSVDDMLLDAAGEAPMPQAAPVPAPVPMIVEQHRMHVFQPPVTGPPIKRTQARSVDKASTLGNPDSSPDARNEAAYPPGGFPATNEQGQRICRQCGFRGRYKDGKCVEKWGPGPAGPGTVCDKCRKKIKRVERRGTLDPAALGPHNVSPPPPPTLEPQPERMTAAKTLPAHLPPIMKIEPERSPPPPARSRASSAASHPPVQQQRSRSYSDAEDELDVDAEADEDDDLANDLLASIES